MNESLNFYNRILMGVKLFKSFKFQVKSKFKRQNDEISTGICSDEETIEKILSSMIFNNTSAKIYFENLILF